MASGQDETLFNNATTAYKNGDYQKAIGLYQEILDNGEHSASVYYNLGNAYYKLNQIANSIYYYEKALLLDPNDPEILNNLGYAQNMALDAIETLPETGLGKFYKGITQKLTFDQWAVASIVFMFLFVIGYIIFYYSDFTRTKRFAFIASMAALFLVVVSISFAYVQYRDYNADQPAIVFADEVGVTSEPNKSGQEVFVLHAGTKVNVLESLDNWNKIRIADGQTGWIPSNDIKLLKDF